MNLVGMNYCSGFGISDDEVFACYKEVGFDATFTMYDVKTGMARIEEFAKATSENGIFYESLHAPYNRINDMWSDDEVIGDGCLEELCDTVRACAEFRIPVAVVHLSSGENAPFINDIGHGRFDRLVECAVRNNVIVAFENQRKIANLAFAFEIYKDVPNVRFCWDMGHEACFTKGIEFMPLFGEKLVYTHIHDNMSEYNGDLHLIPFDGNIDFARRAEHLRRGNYKGTLTLEVSAKPYGLTCREFCKKAFDAVSKTRDMVDCQ